MRSKFAVGFFVAVFAVGFLLCVGPAKADGGIFVPTDKYGAQSNQRALIFYQNQIENLVISAGFRGDAKDFVWVIPTPAKPEVAKSEFRLFNTLSRLTGSDRAYSTVGTLSFGAVSKSEPVNVIEEKEVAIYDTAVLQATDEDALAQWLAKNGYAFPANQGSALKSYVDGGWYFVAAKIQDAFLTDISINRELRTGTLTPLRLTFASDKIIYPMMLTKIAADSAAINPPKISGVVPDPRSMAITLYVISDSKTSESALPTNWANWLSSSDIKSLNDSDASAWLPTDKKLFLTEMDGTIDLSKISGDFIISKATDNEIIPTPAYKTPTFWLANLIVMASFILIGVLSPFGLIFIITIILQRFAIKRRIWFIICMIYQILFCLSLVGIWFSLVSAANEEFSRFILEESSIGATLGLLALFVAGILFIIKMLKRYHLVK